MCPRGQYPWNKTRCTWLKTVYLNNILLKPLFLWLHTLTSSKTSIEFQYNEALIDVFYEWSTSIRPLKGQVIDNLTKKLIKPHNICHDKYNFQDGSICIILEFREKLIHHILLCLLEFFTLLYENDSMLKGMIVIASAYGYVIKSCYFQQHCVIIGRKLL